jgi:4-hydroxybenzoate polyprenyltransferase
VSFPSVFPTWWIALTALSAAGSSAIVLLFFQLRLKTISVLEVVLLTLVVGVSVLVGRLVCNISLLNNDPISGFSPNDLLCPMLTFVMLEIFMGLHPLKQAKAWLRLRALLVLVSFAVNVLTI